MSLQSLVWMTALAPALCLAAPAAAWASPTAAAVSSEVPSAPAPEPEARPAPLPSPEPARAPEAPSPATPAPAAPSPPEEPAVPAASAPAVVSPPSPAPVAPAAAPVAPVAPARAATSPATPLPPQDLPFRTRGPFLSVGYGLHRNSMKTLSMEQDSSDRRAFDGGYLSVQAGYLAGWGGLIGLDWAHHSSKTNLRTAAGALSLRLRSEFISLTTGVQLGGRIRFHLALLTGLAQGNFSRSIRVEEAAGEEAPTSRRDANASSDYAFLLGLDVGLVVMPTTWLAISLRGRADKPFFNDDLDGTGGLYVGLNAAYIFSL